MAYLLRSSLIHSKQILVMTIPLNGINLVVSSMRFLPGGLAGVGHLPSCLTCNQLVVGGFAGPSCASSFETILLRALFPASVPELSKIQWKGLKWQLPGTFLPAFRCCIQGEAKYHSGWAVEEVENLQHVWLSVMPPGHHGSGS